MRINKFLAQLGYGSRRNIDKLIHGKRILVNNQLATIGQQVSDDDIISIDEHLINKTNRETVIVAYHKPKGITSTLSDSHAEQTLADVLPRQLNHLKPVGRLDRDSRGLMILTNHGDTSFRLTHPSFEHEKEYLVRVRPQANQSQKDFYHMVRRLKSEIINPDLQSRPVTVKSSHYNSKLGTGELTLIIREGKKRQIRLILRELGYEVIDLLRTRIHNIELGDLKEGEWRTIKSHDLIL